RPRRAGGRRARGPCERAQRHGHEARPPHGSKALHRTILAERGAHDQGIWPESRRHWATSALMEGHAAAQAAIGRLLGIMDRLRDPGGCPWDREQTLRSLTPYLLEEAHEVIEAIEAGDAIHHREELGDLLFQVVFQSRIAREEGKFDFAAVCDTIAEKLTRRHPHVFGDVSVSGSREVVKNWERIKADERKAKGEGPRSAIGGVPTGLPALIRAERVTEKAAAVGFDWPDVKGVLAKVREELSELEEAMSRASDGGALEQQHVEHELGDLLFALANLGR